MLEEPPTSKTLGYYFILLGGHVTSLFGASIVQFMIIWLITVETNSPVFLSLTSFLSLLPFVIIILFSSVLSDLLNRKIILIVTNIYRISSTFIFIFLIAFGVTDVIFLLLFSIIRSIIEVFYQPTFFAILPSMSPQKHLGRINALTYFLTIIIQILAPFYASLLLLDFPLLSSLLIMSIVSAITLIPLFLIHIPQSKEVSPNTEEHKGKSIIVYYFKNFVDTFRTFGIYPFIIILFGGLLVLEYANSSISLLLPYFLNYVHGLSLFLVSSVYLATTLGAIAGAIVFVIRKYWNPMLVFFFLSMILIFAANTMFIFAPYGALSLLFVANFLKGFLLIFIYSMFYTFIQSIVPNSRLGRVFGVYICLSSIVTPIAVIQSGLFYDITSDIILTLLIPSTIGIIFVFVLLIITITMKLKTKDYKVRDSA